MLLVQGSLFGVITILLSSRVCCASEQKEESKKTKKKVAVVPPGPGLGSQPRSNEDGPCPDLKQPAVSLEARGGFMAMEKRAGVAYAHRNPEEMMMIDDMNEAYGAWQKNYRGDPAYGAARAAPRRLMMLDGHEHHHA